jgi:hypothetical protein
MGKVKTLKSGWIEIGHQAINLNSFSNVRKGIFGMDEAEDSAYYIEVIELKRNEDGSEKKYMITTYRENEKEIWEKDYSNIITALNS